MMKDEKREQYITMTPISAQWSRGGGMQGDPNLPPPVPCNPCSHPFFLSFLPFALFQLRNIMQYNVISPISPASRPLELPPPALFLSRLPFPSHALFSRPLTPCPPPRGVCHTRVLSHCTFAEDLYSCRFDLIPCGLIVRLA